MAIYMQLPNISGNVTTDGFKDWIQVDSLSFKAGVTTFQHVGKSTDRQAGLPFLSEVELTKPIDKSSPHLLSNLFKTTAFSKVVLAVCKGGDSNKAYLTYTLSDVIVSRVEQQVNGHSEQTGTDYVSLSFRKIEEKFTPYDKQGQSLSPISMGYDLTTAQTL
jgi:type VI secretion system secreted protein Hcp